MFNPNCPSTTNNNDVELIQPLRVYTTCSLILFSTQFLHSDLIFTLCSSRGRALTKRKNCFPAISSIKIYISVAVFSPSKSTVFFLSQYYHMSTVHVATGFRQKLFREVPCTVYAQHYWQLLLVKFNRLQHEIDSKIYSVMLWKLNTLKQQTKYLWV